MPIIATILVSPHPLQPGWWDGHHWSERQTARCSNDFLRGTDSGPPQPPGNADSIIWTIESSEASVISFNVSLDVPGPADPVLFGNLTTGSTTPWLPTWTGDVAIDSVPGGTETRPIPYDYERGIYIASVIGAARSFIIELSAENT
jgi:hypothetical protein